VQQLQYLVTTVDTIMRYAYGQMA